MNFDQPTGVRTDVFASTLRLVLEAAAPRHGVDARVYSYQHDFAAIWNLVCQARSETGAWIASLNEHSVYLVHDGLPEGVHAHAKHLTPYDWAIALSCRLGGLATLPALRIVIVDLVAEQSRGRFGFVACNTVRAAIPWIQVFTPVTDLRVPSPVLRDGEFGPHATRYLRAALPLGTCDLADLVTGVVSGQAGVPTLCDAASMVGSPAAPLTSIKALWSAELTRAEERHHISNLVAPIYIAAGFPQELEAMARGAEDPVATTALVELLRAVEVLPDGTGPARAQIAPQGLVGYRQFSDEAPDPFLKLQDIQALLIDDQFQLGYHHVLATLFYGSSYVPTREAAAFFRYSGPGGIGPVHLEADQRWEPLLAALEAGGPIPDWRAPRTFRYRDNFRPDILYLDLRLWSENDGRARSEFFRRLTRASAAIRGDRIPDPAVREALQAAHHVLASPADAIDPSALALLPLLLSHYDPSLPLVIFSSTHQRAVSELLVDRPNVTTRFMKPLVSGYREASPAETVIALRKATEHALDAAVIRAPWERLSRIGSTYVSWRALRRGYPRAARSECPGLNVSPTRLAQFAAEFRRAVLAGRFADGLMGPYNLLEVTEQWPLELTDLEDGDPLLEIVDTDEYRAELWWWKPMALLRHARAHYQVTHADDPHLRELAGWLWLWFFAGLEKPLTTGTCPLEPSSFASAETRSIWSVMGEELLRLDRAQGLGLVIADEQAASALPRVLAAVRRREPWYEGEAERMDGLGRCAAIRCGEEVIRVGRPTRGIGPGEAVRFQRVWENGRSHAANVRLTSVDDQLRELEGHLGKPVPFVVEVIGKWARGKVMGVEGSARCRYGLREPQEVLAVLEAVQRDTCRAVLRIQSSARQRER